MIKLMKYCGENGHSHRKNNIADHNLKMGNSKNNSKQNRRKRKLMKYKKVKFIINRKQHLVCASDKE